MIEKKVSTYSVKENHPEKEGITFSVELTIDHETKSFNIKPSLKGYSEKGFVFTNSAKVDIKAWKAVVKAIDKAIDFAEQILEMEKAMSNPELIKGLNKAMENFKKSILDEKPLFISLESQFSEEELNELKSGVDVETVISNRIHLKLSQESGEEMLKREEYEEFLQRMNKQTNTNYDTLYDYLNHAFLFIPKEKLKQANIHFIKRNDLTDIIKSNIISIFFPKYKDNMNINGSFIDNDFEILKDLYFNKINFNLNNE